MDGITPYDERKRDSIRNEARRYDKWEEEEKEGCGLSPRDANVFRFFSIYKKKKKIIKP
jgi:hypothetical protein